MRHYGKENKLWAFLTDCHVACQRRLCRYKFVELRHATSHSRSANHEWVNESRLARWQPAVVYRLLRLAAQSLSWVSCQTGMHGERIDWASFDCATVDIQRKARNTPQKSIYGIGICLYKGGSINCGKLIVAIFILLRNATSLKF